VKNVLACCPEREKKRVTEHPWVKIFITRKKKILTNDDKEKKMV
jgi:hypothetical protein